MISKRRNYKIKRKTILKRKKKYGGKKGDIYTWNLGLFLIKKQENGWFLGNTYWIEYPVDALPIPWQQIPPNKDNILPSYSLNTSLNLTVNIRPIENTSWEEIISLKHAPADVWDRYLEKLRKIKPEKTVEIPETRFIGKYKFVKNFFSLHVKYYNKRDKGIEHDEYIWILKQYFYIIFLMIQLSLQENVPEEFKSLYKIISVAKMELKFGDPINTKLEQLLKDNAKEVIYNTHLLILFKSQIK